MVAVWAVLHFLGGSENEEEKKIRPHTFSVWVANRVLVAAEFVRVEGRPCSWVCLSATLHLKPFLRGEGGNAIDRVINGSVIGRVEDIYLLLSLGLINCNVYAC